MTTDPPSPVTAEDENRHAPGSEPLWSESWYLDWAELDATAGGYVRLGLYPNLGVAWWWLYIVEEGRGPVLVRNHTLACPDSAAGEPVETLSGPGVSVDVEAVAPLERFVVRSAGAATRLGSAVDAFTGEGGTPCEVSIELTWTGVGPVFPYAMTTRYEQSARVTGTVTVDGRSRAVDVPGQRDHSWGWRDWWMFPWNWTSGTLEDGTAFHGARSLLPDAELFHTGYTLEPAGAAGLLRSTDVVTVGVDVDAEKLPLRARHVIGDLAFEAEAALAAPLLLVADDGRRTRFARALCRYRTPDGRRGSGWTEYNWPEGFPR